VGEEFGGLSVVASREFALEAGFGGGIEGERHGESIPLGLGRVEEGRLVASAAGLLRPAAARNPLIRMKPRMNGAPGRTNYDSQRMF